MKSHSIFLQRYLLYELNYHGKLMLFEKIRENHSMGEAKLQSIDNTLLLIFFNNCNILIYSKQKNDFELDFNELELEFNKLEKILTKEP